MSDETIKQGPSTQWNLVQFGFLCLYTAGFQGFCSFPYYIYTHSGLFLIAHLVVTLLVCIPVCYVQIKLGALYRRGVVGIFSWVMPFLKGIGIVLLLITYNRCLLHGLELAYSLYYACAALENPFPWSAVKLANATSHLRPEQISYIPAERYFISDFLRTSVNIGVGGVLLWYLVLLLLVVWTILYICVVKGTAMFAKISYFLSPFALFLLVAIMGYGYSTVPNAGKALHSLFTANLRNVDDEFGAEPSVTEILKYRLGNPRIWMDSLLLQVQNLGLWSGVLPTLGMHLPSTKRMAKFAWVIPVVMSSVLPVLLVVALAPYLDPQSSGRYLSVAKGIPHGFPLVFISIPGTLSKYGLSSVIGFAIFLCYFVFGLFHQVLHLLAILENLLPAFPDLIRRMFLRNEALVAVFCIASLLLSLGYTCQGGFDLYRVVHNFIDRLIFVPIIISIVPYLTAYVKQEYLHLPIERACMSVWYGAGSLITGCLLIYFFAAYVYAHPVVSYDHRWAEDIGWCVAAAPIIIGLISGALHSYLYMKGTLKEKLKAGLWPDITSLEPEAVENDSIATGETHQSRQSSNTMSEEDAARSNLLITIQPSGNSQVDNV